MAYLKHTGALGPAAFRQSRGLMHIKPRGSRCKRFRAKIGTCSKVRVLQGTRSIASSVSPGKTCACRGLHSAMLRILMRGGVEASSSIMCIPTPATLSSVCADCAEMFGDLSTVRRGVKSQNVSDGHNFQIQFADLPVEMKGFGCLVQGRCHWFFFRQSRLDISNNSRLHQSVTLCTIRARSQHHFDRRNYPPGGVNLPDWGEEEDI